MPVCGVWCINRNRPSILAFLVYAGGSTNQIVERILAVLAAGEEENCVALLLKSDLRFLQLD